MPLSIEVNEIEPGRLAEWNDFVAELLGPRRIEWAESHRRRGIRRVVISTVSGDGPPLAVVLVDAADRRLAADGLKRSGEPFDVWLRERLTDLLGRAVDAALLADTAPRRGPWPGLRRPGGRP
ncbi:MAG: hypothetical protein WEA29_04910 [Acidimicrobiia bacterium]